MFNHRQCVILSTLLLLCSAPVGDSHFGRLDAGMLVLGGEDRLPQLGPITAFAMGSHAQCGTTSSGETIMRGGSQLLACVGHGRSGALAVVQGSIVPQQDGAVDFRALGQCTGLFPFTDLLPLLAFFVILVRSSSYIQMLGQVTEDFALLHSGLHEVLQYWCRCVGSGLRHEQVLKTHVHGPLLPGIHVCVQLWEQRH